MGAISLGPSARATLARMSYYWKQGEHILVTGGTGSGKTALVRYLSQIRLDRQGSVVVFVAKLQEDSTIRDYYSDFTRWKTWKRKPKANEDRILFWPDVEGKTATEAKEILKEQYRIALEEISRVGRWTVIIDEGLYTTAPEGLNLSALISSMYQLIRSANGTMITLAQRPAHLPLSIYANVSYAIVGQAREQVDVKRLANLDAGIDSRTMQRMISSNGRHDFIVISTKGDLPPERLNLAR